MNPVLLDQIVRQQEEIEALRAQVAELEKDLVHFKYQAHDAGMLRVRLATVTKDAERYNFVRKLHPSQFQDLWERCLNNDIRFDDAIDKSKE